MHSIFKLTKIVCIKTLSNLIVWDQIVKPLLKLIKKLKENILILTTL